jgi:hypothetical protein
VVGGRHAQWGVETDGAASKRMVESQSRWWEVKADVATRGGWCGVEKSGGESEHALCDQNGLWKVKTGVGGSQQVWELETSSGD